MSKGHNLEISPAIVVVAFNRLNSLRRLLNSLVIAHYDDARIPLVISVDKSPESHIEEYLKSFTWPYGKLDVIIRDEHLGLKKHILSCGDTVNVYESIIMLEDDLIVSKEFYRFAKASVSFYIKNERIAGISLYNYQTTENGFYPFNPVEDGADVYFIQVASSWGQVWTKSQWQGFRDWYLEDDPWQDLGFLPHYLNDWDESSWKRWFIRYLIERNKYFVFPRISLSSNYEEPGSGVSTRGYFQVPLLMGPKEYNFINYNDSLSIYDAWYEYDSASLKKLVPVLKDFDFTVDLYGTKDLFSLNCEYAITSKSTKNPVLSFGNEMLPPETNIIQNVQGNTFKLAKIKSFINHKGHQINTLTLEPWKLGIILLVDTCTDDLLEFTLKSLCDLDSSLVDILISTSYELKTEIITILDKYQINNYHLYLNSEGEGLGTKIHNVVSRSPIDYFVILHTGEFIISTSLSVIRQALKDFPTFNWIKGLSLYCNKENKLLKSTTVPEERWSESRFVNTSKPKIYAFSTVWSRQLWNNIDNPDKISVFNDLWYLFFKQMHLYTIDQPIGATVTFFENVNPVPYMVSEYFYLKDIRYGRVLYRERFGLPPILRYEKDKKAFYISDY